MSEQERTIGNIIRVGDKKINHYEHAILVACAPEVYDEYGKIIIQSTLGNLSTTEHLIKLFRHVGLYEDGREKKKIMAVNMSGQSYPLEIYEIILKKIPALLHL